MNPDVIFKIAAAGAGLVTYGTAIYLFSLRRPTNRFLRGFLSALVAWVLGVVYTIYVYNPLGISAGHYNGVHFPESNFGNNTVSVALVGGWIGPAIILSIMGIFQAIRDDVGLRTAKPDFETSSDSKRE